MPIRSSTGSIPTPTAAEVPVTSGTLAHVRVEVLERVDQARAEAASDNRRLEGRIDQLDAKIDQLDAKIDHVHAELTGKIDQLDAKIDHVRAELTGKIDQLDAKIDAAVLKLGADINEVKALVARTVALMEEQEARNRVVLDGLMAMISQHNELKQRVVAIEETVHSLAAGRRNG